MENELLDKLIEEIGEFKHGIQGGLENNLGKELFEKVVDRLIEKFSSKTIEELFEGVINKKNVNPEIRAFNFCLMNHIVQNKINEEFGYEKRRPLNEKQIELLARRTIEGDFGNGMVRKKKLGENFKRVQNKVNRIKNKPFSEDYDIKKLSIDEYINKLFTRQITDGEVKRDVGELLYNFIRNKVNEYEKNENRFEINKECIDLLARNTIKLEFSEGEERKEKLGELYPFVQNRVNEILGCETRHDTSNKPWYLNLSDN